jgi:excisionase family DNA binding protein
MLNEPQYDASATLLSLPKVAERLDVSVSTAKRMVRAGALRGLKVGRQWRMSEAELARWVAEQVDRDAERRAGERGEA